MTKADLKNLIIECLNEVVDVSFMAKQPETDVTVKVTTIGEQMDQIVKYTTTTIEAVLDTFVDGSVEIGENWGENPKFQVLPNNDKKVVSTFTIPNIQDEEDRKEVLAMLNKLEEKLTLWSISKDLVIEVYWHKK